MEPKCGNCKKWKSEDHDYDHDYGMCRVTGIATRAHCGHCCTIIALKEEPKPPLRDGDVVIVQNYEGKDEIAVVADSKSPTNDSWYVQHLESIKNPNFLFNILDLAVHKGTILLVPEGEIGVGFTKAEMEWANGRSGDFTTRDLFRVKMKAALEAAEKKT